MSGGGVAALRSRLGVIGERDFGMLWTGRVLSLLGDYAFRIALITYLITETGSPWSLAVAGAVLTLPSLVFYLYGGAVGDTADSRRRIMVAADVGRFAAAGAITVAVLLSAHPAVVVVLALLLGVGEGFFMPASFALLTEIVRKDRLVAANSANSVGQQIALIAGPMLGGVLIGALGAAAAFGFNALTFLASAVCILAIRNARSRRTEEAEAAAAEADPVAADTPESAADGSGDAGGDGGGNGPRKVLSDIAGGFGYVLGHRWLVVSFAVGMLANAVFTGSLDVTVPFVLSPGGVEEAADLGGFYALEGAGALLGALILVRLTVVRVGTGMFAMLAMMAAALLMVGVFGDHPGAFAMAVVYGVGLHFFNSLFPSLLQAKVPEHLMSRVGSIVFLAFNGLMPLGTLVMGPAVDAFGPLPVLMASGGAVAVMCAAAALLPSIRALRMDDGSGDGSGGGTDGGEEKRTRPSPASEGPA
ncbi:MFS transporter [Nocardiopsis sp. RSe5-2]|uniref:MFS transporter n=1 Tax=Nocardiopsis endophytica TaxID=3018445 RepID=A0ABT4U9Y7_9ACTN|nr:MFS transporter [Nocardiopsis endophytica]MDA2813546.1 MFS transporter [Nocardiopsis endophytica]